MMADVDLSLHKSILYDGMMKSSKFVAKSLKFVHVVGTQKFIPIRLYYCGEIVHTTVCVLVT